MCVKPVHKQFSPVELNGPRRIGNTQTTIHRQPTNPQTVSLIGVWVGLHCLQLQNGKKNSVIFPVILQCQKKMGSVVEGLSLC